MKNLLKIFSIVSIIVYMSSCGSRSCQECTRVDTDGENNDITVCDSEEGTSSTNNITGSVLDDRRPFAAVISFYEGHGYTCE